MTPTPHDPPEGFDGDSSFNDALAAELERAAQPTLGAHTWTILIISALLWLGAESTMRDDPTFILGLAGVLLFHELGHLAAMKVFGYRDLRMLFLPFLGAAVTARQNRASGAQQAIVALAGPVPGLVLGVVLVIVSDEPVVQQVAILAIVVNAFNLLPMQPFDGGAFLHRVVFHRFPTAERIFETATAVLTVWYSFATESWILLVFIVVTLTAAPFQRRVRGIARRLRTELGLFDEDLLEVPEAGRTRLAAEISEALDSSRVKPTPKALAQAMHNAWNGSSGRPASLGASIGLGIVYAIMAIPSMWLLWFSVTVE